MTPYDETSAVSTLRFIQTKDHALSDVKEMLTKLELAASNRSQIRRIGIYDGAEFK